MVEFESEILTSTNFNHKNNDITPKIWSLAQSLVFDDVINEFHIRTSHNIENLTSSKADIIKSDISKLSKFENDEEFIIDQLNGNVKIGDKSHFIVNNFISFKNIDKLEVFIKKWTSFNGIEISSSSFPNDIRNQDDIYQIFLDLTSDFEFSNWPFQPKEFISDKEKIPNLELRVFETSDDLIYFTDKFLSENPEIDLYKIYFRKRRTIVYYEFTDETKKYVKVSLKNNYEKMEYIHDIETGKQISIN